jgi:hypothetical protein
VRLWDSTVELEQEAALLCCDALPGCRIRAPGERRRCKRDDDLGARAAGGCTRRPAADHGDEENWK